MAQLRVGMIVPSLNTIAEDDFRRALPAEIGYHVHRVRLRREPGKVLVSDLQRAYGEAEQDARTVADLKPDAIAYNCTGVSVAPGPDADKKLSDNLTALLGIPTLSTMTAIKSALLALGIKSLVHVCPFEGESSQVEKVSLEADGFDVVSSTGLGYTDARVVAKLTPEELARVARERNLDSADGILLSCANARAMEAAEMLEKELGKPVVTSNQAMIWAIARAAGWTGGFDGGGTLMSR